MSDPMSICGFHKKQYEVTETHPDPEHGGPGHVSVTRYCVLCANSRLIEENMQLMRRSAVLYDAVKVAYDTLPDSTFGPDWADCFDVLNAESQANVKRARRKIAAALTHDNLLVPYLNSLVDVARKVRQAMGQSNDRHIQWYDYLWQQLGTALDALDGKETKS